MFNYNNMIKDVNNDWLYFFDKTKHELDYIINKLNFYIFLPLL